MKSILLSVISIALLTFSIVCLFFSKAIREYALHMKNGPPGASLQQYLASDAYLISLRFCGVISLLMSGVIAWAVIDTLTHPSAR